MKKQFLLLSVLFIFISILNSVVAQRQANIWYFGSQAGVDFNSGAPVALTNGQLNTTEGCSSIADANGNLLFYSDGMNVWNQNHQIMPNGTGLGGNPSSTQSALIVQQPGSPNIYYIFVIDINYSYSIVDMNLNGGLGDITSKNVLILSNCMSEKQCGTTHANGNDIWLIMHEINTNGFKAFVLSSAGFNLTPVTTNIGMVHTSPYGQMKISPNGSHISVGIYSGSIGSMELFDFDKSTGVVSNNIAIPTTYAQCYGTEFSPDNSKLYGTSNPDNDIYQWDLNAGSPAAILASVTLIGSSGTNTAAGMQLAPDGKIYLSPSGTNFLHAINNPNDLGLASNFVLNAVSLGTGFCQLGLPEFISSYFKSLTFENTCFGDTTYFSLGSTSSIAGASWNFGDPLSGVDNISTLFNPGHLFTAAGIYTVQLITYNFNGGTDTSYAQVEIYSMPQTIFGNDTTICDGTSLLLNAGSGFDTYLWQDGSTLSTFSATDSGTYFVTIGAGDCLATDSIVVSTIVCSQPIVAAAASDSSFCEKNCIDFFDLSTNSPTSWQWFFPGSDSTSSNVQNPTGICYNSLGSFDVTLIACNSNGCDTLVLYNFINEYPNPTDSIWNSNDTLYSLPAISYQWYEISSGLISGATLQYYVPLQPGSYYCVVTDSIGCVATSNTIALTSVEYAIGNMQLAIFPNPNNGNFEISFGSNFQFDGQWAITIYDAVGQVVYNSPLTTHHSLLTTYLIDGIYFVEVKSGDKIFRNKFIVKN